MKKEKQNNKGFSLLELLVVILIVGVLAAIALPQYRMAVTKSRVASILPLMRRWLDAYAEYNLRHGSYCISNNNGACSDVPDTDTLGVSWPSDWTCDEDYLNGGYCWNDYWICLSNENMCGDIYCSHYFSDEDEFDIELFQPNSMCDGGIGLRQCCATGPLSHKTCLAIGGTYQKYDCYSF